MTTEVRHEIPIDLTSAVLTSQNEETTFNVTVVIPTRNEAGNVEELVRQLDAGLGDLNADILFVDDSDDDTPKVIQRVALESRRPVRLLHRRGADRTGGLGGAIVAGFRAARAPWAVVMDGDLQHPPQVVPQIMGRTIDDKVNLVVASRYTDEGDSSGLSSKWRVFVSLAFTWMARVLFPFRLGSVSDPMSGFFAVRLSALDLDSLRPAGYKILLEIVARSHLGRAPQVPFSFQARHAGESKASAKEAYLYVRQLVRLRFAAWASPAKRMASFLLVGASGVIVNTLLLALLLQATRMSYVLASVVATQVAILWNYILLRSWVFRGADGRSFLSGLVRFWTLNMVLLPVHLGLLALLVEVANMGPITANVIVLAIIFILRYAVSSVWVFRIRHGRAPADIDEELEDLEAWIVDGGDNAAREPASSVAAGERA